MWHARSGAFVLGHLGDTHGRKQVLLICMFMMGFSTMAVGVLPTYQQVGILAPVLLVVLRLIQGFAVAGEISGASSMILEHAPFGTRRNPKIANRTGVRAELGRHVARRLHGADERDSSRRHDLRRGLRGTTRLQDRFPP
jgi:MFS family permease